MSVSTHLNTLRAFRQWVRSSESPQMLLQQALSTIQNIDESVSELRLYQVKEHHLSLSYTTQEEQTPVQVNPSVTQSHSQALTLRKPVYNSSGGFWVVPLESLYTAYGLLEIVANAPSGDEAETEATFSFLIEAMTQALDLRALSDPDSEAFPTLDETSERANVITSRQVSERQTRAFNEMVIGQDLASMATIIARHMLPEPDRHLAIHEITYNSVGQPNDWTALDREDSRPRRALHISIAWDDLSHDLRAQVEQGETLYIDDLKNSSVSAVGDKLHRWLSTQNMQSLIICPIAVDELVVAVQTVTSQRKNAFTLEEINAFRNLADQMGVLSKVRQLLNDARHTRDIVDNVALANRLVAVAGDYAYMAQGISYTIARDMLAVAVTLFDHPVTDVDTPEFRRVVGLSTKDEMIEVDSALEREDIPTPEQLVRMQNSLPLIFKTLDSPEIYLSDETRATYNELGASWMVSFGLRIENHLLGTMDILHNANYELSQEEIDAFTTLADQIGVNIRSRQLLEETRIAHDMAAQLVETNTQIAIAENYEEMASSVIHALPDNIELVGIMLFDEPISSREMPQWIKVEVFASRDEVITPGIIDYTSDENTVVLRTIKTLIDGEMLLIGDARDLDDDVLSEITSFLIERGLFSFAAIALRTGARLQGIITFCARNIESLNSLQLDNLRAIAGQVGIAIENRNLLNQTADALSFVAAQYEMSNAMFRAKTPQEMLIILNRFSEEMYEKAMVSTIEEDGVNMRLLAQTVNGDIVEGAREETLSPVPDEVLNSDQHVIISDDKTLILLPLVTTSNDLVGVVQFANPEPVEMPFNQLRALRSLADQMALALENRALLQKTDRTLKETLTVYEIGQAVSASKDSLEILSNIRQTIAPDAVSLSLVNVEYDIITDTVNGLVLYSLVTADRAERVQVQLHEHYGEEIIGAFTESHHSSDSEIDFRETLTDEAIQADPVIRYLAEIDIPVASAVTLPIFSEEMMVQQVVITFAKTKRFSERERRLYAALRDQAAVVLENHRLLLNIRTSAAQLGNQVRILQSINQLSTNLSTAQDETMLLEEASQSLVNALGIDHVGIALVNPDGISATVVSEYPLKGAIGAQIEEDNALQREIIASRQPYLISNVEKDPDIAEGPRQQLLEMGIKSVMIFPMIDLKDRFLGSIGLDIYRDSFAFTPEIIDVARTITAQVVISLQNVRQFQDTQRQAEQLQRLAEFSQRLQAQLQVESIRENIAIDTPTILACEYVNVYAYDLRNSHLQLVAQSIKGKVSKLEAKLEAGQVAPPEGTIAAHAWTNREFMIIKNLELHEELRFSTGHEVKSALAAPYFARGVAIGVIEIGHSAAYIHTDTDQIIFRQLVNQIGIASENAEAYTQSQRIAKSKALVNEISSELQEQIDVSSILNVTVNELGRALGARRGRIRLGTGDNGTERK